MTFRDFLIQRDTSYDAQGDFVRLALADPNLPDEANWNEMRPYFVQRHKNERVVDAGEDVWKEFQAAQRRARRAAKS